jgi:hypothetical protein
MNNRWRIFKCHNCGLEFEKYTPSTVEKCVVCKNMVLDRNGKENDPYSRAKERWYKYGGDEYHLHEIRNRKIVYREGKPVQVVMSDDGKHIVDESPVFSVDGVLGKKEAVQK